MAAYPNNQTEEEKRLAAEQAAKEAETTRQANIAANQEKAADSLKQQAQSAFEGISKFLTTPPQPPEALASGTKEQVDNTASPQQSPLTTLPKSTDTASPLATSPLTQSPAPITQQAMSGIPDLTTQPSPLAPPQNVNQSSYGGISQPWMYTGANDKVIGLGGTVQPSLAKYPDANGDRTMRRPDGAIWTTADSNNLIQQQMAANNTPEAQAYDIAMRNRVRADNGQAPIESPFDKQAQGINSKEQLAMAKLLQDQQQFSETQDNKMRDEIYKGAVAAFGNDETINSAYGDKRISTQQFGAISSIADPQKRTEALQRMQDAAEKVKAERKKQEEEDKGRRLSAQARSDARRKNTMANLSSLIG